LRLDQQRIEPLEDLGAQPGQRLVRLHHVEIDIDADVENAERLANHLAVLAGGDHDGVAQGWALSARMTGAILMPSGRVPTRQMIFEEGSGHAHPVKP
jgi:hypothetical protein